MIRKYDEKHNINVAVQNRYTRFNSKKKGKKKLLLLTRPHSKACATKPPSKA